jgi:hypothetical protein
VTGLLIPEAVYPVPRDPAWEALSLKFRKAHPSCWGCGRPTQVAHHVKPFHLFPALELVESNLAAVCDLCHLCLCHLGDFHLYDPTCLARLRDHLARVRRGQALAGEK